MKTEDVEYERALKELTFKPTINNRKTSAKVTQYMTRGQSPPNSSRPSKLEKPLTASQPVRDRSA